VIAIIAEDRPAAAGEVAEEPPEHWRPNRVDRAARQQW
jgi:hypothetical protein